MNFIPTYTLLDSLKTFLADLELAPATDEQPAVKFDRVEMYSALDLVQALEDLRIFKNRVCLIVPSSDDSENVSEGTELRSSLVRTFEIIVADRDYGRRQNASTGDADTLGVIRIKDIVHEKLWGSNLGLEPRRLNFRLIGGEAIVLTQKQRETLSGREAWQMTWQCDAGTAVL